MDNVCTECGSTIQMMCFKNTGVCGEICRKANDVKKPKRKSRKRT